LVLPIIFYTSGCGRNNESGVQLPVEEVQIKGVLFELEMAWKKPKLITVEITG
jgi:hypothetical protein